MNNKWVVSKKNELQSPKTILSYVHVGLTNFILRDSIYSQK